MRVSKDDDMPKRMKRGNEERPDRVPTPGHEGPVEVDRRTWESNERRRDTSKGHADERAPTE